jgi:hypothetical protein
VEEGDGNGKGEKMKRNKGPVGFINKTVLGAPIKRVED